MIPVGVLAQRQAVSGSDPLAAFDWEWRFESDSITGLSDGDPVATWPDTSGNGRDATQSTPANRPTYDADAFGSLPGVAFGYLTNQRLTTAAIAALSQPSTIWFVANEAPVRADTQNHFDGITSTSRHVAWTSASSFLYAGGTISLGAAALMRSAGVFACRYNGSSTSAWRGGTLIGAGTVGTQSLTGLTIGNRFVNAESSDRAFGAFMVINAAQTAAEMNTIGNHLAAKYGLTWTDIP